MVFPDGRSRPAWARGLKYWMVCPFQVVGGSRPAWARGLKCLNVAAGVNTATVAPRVGAWIEIINQLGQRMGKYGRAPRGRVD